MSPVELKDYVRSIPDFPQPGILFRDITPLLRDARAFGYALDELTQRIERLGVTAIVGIESRGFLFGTPMAVRLGLPFVPVRKPGKLPSARMSVEVTLEYGTSQLDIHSDALGRGDRVAIVDDLLATGGTAAGAAKLVELLGAQVAGMVFLIELASLGGRGRLDAYSVDALVVYD
jgi:adenine phosphoribosyltransferase